MDRVLIDISAVPETFFRENAKPFGSSPGHKVAGAFERPAITSAVSLGSKVSEPIKKFQVPIDNADRNISTTIRKRESGKSIIDRIIDVVLSATYCIGPAGSVSVLFGLSMGGGVYGYYPTREIGWYSSLGFNVSSSVGGAAEMQLTVMFGPPSLLDGIAKSIEIDVSGPWKVMFLGGVLVFDASWKLTGIAFVGGGGFSLNPLPASITATISVGTHGKLVAFVK